MLISAEILENSGVKNDWKTLYIGLKMNLIKQKDIVNYAVNYLTKHPNCSNQIVIDLAWGGNEIEFESLLLDLINEESIFGVSPDVDDWKIEKRKWRYGLLVYLKKKYQDDSEELLNKIAEVYADFNYPEDMEKFINYLEPKDGFDPSLYTKEENVTRLLSFYNDFMQKEQRYLQKVD